MLVTGAKDKNEIRERDTNYQRGMQFKIGWPGKAFLRSQLNRFRKEVKKQALNV